jgi:DNA-binding winged helix-turn-helix (wHTH) protein/tetratricopeptide (TPR) repeat protein
MADPFVIDGWLAQPDLNTFSRGNRSVRVEPKVMEVCVRLAQSAGTVVSKPDLLESVWPGTTVGEDALTRAVSELRRSLCDDAKQPRIIETIPKRGYRLIAPLERVTANPTLASPAVAGRWSSYRPPARAMTLAVAALLTVLVWVAFTRRPEPEVRDSAPRTLSVLVAGVHNTTGVATALPQLLQHTIEEALASDGRLIVVTAERVKQTVLRMRREPQGSMAFEMALEVAQRDGGIAGVITGQLERTHDEHVLTLRLVDVSAGSVTRTVVTRAPDDSGLMTAAARQSAALIQELGALGRVAAPRLPAVTTSSFSALRLFAQAIALTDSVMAPEAAPWPKSIELLRLALADDPEFAIAKVWLGWALKKAEDARLSHDGGTRASSDEFRRYARQALELSAAVTDAERLFIEGVAYALLEEPNRAIAALEALLWGDAPLLEVWTRVLLVSLYSGQGRWPDTVQHVLRLAQLRPSDFDVNAVAAQAVVTQDGGYPERAAPYVAAARRLLTPAIIQRENSCWSAAWLEHLPAYHSWLARDMPAVMATLTQIRDTLANRTFKERSAYATTNGYFWLSLGQIREARRVFETPSRVNQRELNLANLADAIDNRRQMAVHLTRHGWAYNPAPFARAGLFDRARAIAREPAHGANRALHDAMARAEELLSAGRFRETEALLEPIVVRLRTRPHLDFYNASLSRADAWEKAGDHAQALRVLEETVVQPPRYVVPGLSAAWWIKAQVRLVIAYRRAGRDTEAAELESRVRTLLSQADADHPLFATLAGGLSTAERKRAGQ